MHAHTHARARTSLPSPNPARPGPLTQCSSSPPSAPPPLQLHQLNRRTLSTPPPLSLLGAFAVARLQHRLRRHIPAARRDQPFRTRDIQRALHDNGQQVNPSDRIRQPSRRLLVQLASRIQLAGSLGAGAGPAVGTLGWCCNSPWR